MAYFKKNPDGYKVHSNVLKSIDDILILEETVERVVCETVFWIVQFPFVTMYKCYNGSKV
jgi:hypothetical protein